MNKEETKDPMVEGDPFSEDLARQAAVLRQVLEDQPTFYQLPDLARRLDLNPEKFAERDVLMRAVEDLVRAGLLYRVGDLVLPSAAATHFHTLSHYDS